LAISKKVDVVFIVGSRELDPTYDDPIFCRVTFLAQPDLLTDWPKESILNSASLDRQRFLFSRI